MLLRSLLRSTTTTIIPIPTSHLLLNRHYAKSKPSPKKSSAKAPKAKGGKGAKGSPLDPIPSAESSSSSSSSADTAVDSFDPSADPIPHSFDPLLDVGPGGRPLFTHSASFSTLSHRHASTYVDLSLEDWKRVLPEGLPPGMMKEFEETRRCAVMVRKSFLDLRDNFRRLVDPAIQTSRKGLNLKKQIVLDGPVSCGKSVALAMLVHWARSEGWLVFYVPKGKEWTHGGFFYQNNHLWDTPVHAHKVLQDFVIFNESRLQKLPCQVYDPIPLGEGAGVGMMRGVDSMSMPEDSTLYDLIQTGITYSQASVGVVVRLRKELSLVKDIPVLFAIDQYNSWFTFSEYEEPVTLQSCRPIHAKELTTVKAYRSMIHNDMMVGAFSHSTAVGKLRQELPDVPQGARVMFPRYSVDEAATVCHYYLRQNLIKREQFSDDKWKKIYYLSNGNGSEMRWLAPFI